MLLRIMPDQIPTYWEELKAGLHKALPEGMPDRDQRLLCGLHIGMLQAWVSLRKDLSGNKVDGIIVTSVVDDKIHDTKNLLIYALWSIGDTVPSTWIEGFESLRKFAAKRGCSRIIAYSCEPKILEIAHKLGANIEFRLISWDL